MAATATPDIGLTTNANTRRLRYLPESGEQSTFEWRGLKADIEAKYTQVQSDAGLASLDLSAIEGRARLVATYSQTEPEGGDPAGIDHTIIEELYAVDHEKGILNAPYFNVGGTAELTADKKVFVREVVDLSLQSGSTGPSSIDKYVGRKGFGSSYLWANWTDAMKRLRQHLINGHEAFLETRFILRRSKYGIRTSSMDVLFVGINTVGVAPEFVTPMNDLISSLPEGEWLNKPPSVQYLGKGRWRTEEEWHWADQWSVIYGGTWGEEIE